MNKKKKKTVHGEQNRTIWVTDEVPMPEDHPPIKVTHKTLEAGKQVWYIYLGGDNI